MCSKSFDCTKKAFTDHVKDFSKTLKVLGFSMGLNNGETKDFKCINSTKSVAQLSVSN